MEAPTSLNSFARRQISTIFVYTLPRLCISNIHRSNKRKWFHMKKARSRQYLTETMTDADYADDLALLKNTPVQNESLLNSLEQTVECIGFYVNAYNTEYISFKQKTAIYTLNGKLLKLVDQFTYLSSNISFTESDVNIHLTNKWNAIERLSIIWKSELSDKIKLDFFQAIAVYILLYGCTTWMLKIT